MKNKELWAAIVGVSLAGLGAFGGYAYGRPGKTDNRGQDKRVSFENNYVSVADATFSATAAGDIVMVFDEPYPNAVVGSQTDPAGVFQCCTPGGQCVINEEDGNEPGIGLSAGVERCIFSGGGSFEITRIIPFP